MKASVARGAPGGQRFMAQRSAHAKIARVATEITAIRENLERVRERIARAAARASRATDEITLVAVSKTFPAEAVHAAYEVGLRHFGENRVQEFEGKQRKLAGLDAVWHFIGHLQRNKTRRAVQLFQRVDGVDNAALVNAMQAEAAAQEKRLPILIEVRLSDEPTKTGVAQAELQALAESVMASANLKLRGLMGVPPYFEETERTRPYFSKLREMRDALSKRLGIPLPVLSMGMSHDLEVAIEEGATEVRVGTALFGERARPAT
ncbi:MAG TPA: YggS family pyridoxal phosphate-dependent enzyme [Candidatus Baltobacteraceae bacterium]|nr:YggS family pyridoxal phosphate-dependent enzyme [Candidatus Baltobacteraceae bacterium]